MAESSAKSKLPQFPHGGGEVVFSFDATVPGTTSKVPVSHKVNRPTKGQLHERDFQQKLEIVEVGKNQEKTQSDYEKAQSWLYDQICVEVKGYDGTNNWLNLADIKETVDAFYNHKVAVIAQLEKIKAEVHEQPIVSLKAAVGRQVIIKATIPGYQPIFTYFRLPTPQERMSYNQNVVNRVEVKGTKENEGRAKLIIDISTACKLYQATAQKIVSEDETVYVIPEEQKMREAWFDKFDAILQQAALNKMMEAVSLESSDSTNG